MSLLLIGRLHSCLQVADIVQTVKNTNDINTIGNGLLYKVLHHIICIVVISQEDVYKRQG